VPIDASGELDGSKFNDPASLGQTLRNNPAIPACLTRRASEYAMRRPLGDDEAGWIKELTSAFTRHGYRLRALLREIATSAAFYGVSSASSTLAKEVTK
jgi:hypothetical protein